MSSQAPERRWGIVVAALAAFCTYFCMYAYRKPFAAGTFEGSELFGLGLKSILVISQGAGYMVSKFIGIKIISEMQRTRRAVAIIGFILFAQLSLAGFAIAPLWLKPVMMFLNGLPLGMVFGLVMGYLEGRRQTEALSAVLCASFIMSSGVVKSVGQWMIQTGEVSEYTMPMFVGLLFFPALLLSVWVLKSTPPPDSQDIASRSERGVMTRADRRAFVAAYWPGLFLLVFVYVCLTVIRTIRDDFGVEIWRDMGVERPVVFTQSETIVAILVTALNGAVIVIQRHLTALKITFGLMGASFAVVALSAWRQSAGELSPLAFMITCGIGLYIPYVAYHTTIFERLIAASGRPCNLGFLLYLADAIGYLGYSVVLVFRETHRTVAEVLPFFKWLLIVLSAVSFVAILLSLLYFQRKLGPVAAAANIANTKDRPVESLAATE